MFPLCLKKSLLTEEIEIEAVKKESDDEGGLTTGRKNCHLLVWGLFEASSNELCTQREINTADDWGDVDYCLRTIGHQSVSSSYNAVSRCVGNFGWWDLERTKMENGKKEEEEEEERKRKELRQIIRTNGQMQSSVLRTALPVSSAFHL